MGYLPTVIIDVKDASSVTSAIEKALYKQFNVEALNNSLHLSQVLEAVGF
ncbi:MAG: hypothetical protein M3O33_13410 [Cyanobacteriota bacterium]|jgi:hypothetical protein|nr:hypothetical protein [Cyanobacteriota bacterium]